MWLDDVAGISMVEILQLERAMQCSLTFGLSRVDKDIKKKKLRIYVCPRFIFSSEFFLILYFDKDVIVELWNKL